LIAKGAGWAESPAEVGSPCSVVFAMLSTPQVVGETAERLLSSVKPKSLWIDCSFSREMAAKLFGIKQ
jgi:3-hydroxyisobutyrate dehydrogenase/glyoxylate/succinic semialdehyde reductase